MMVATVKRLLAFQSTSRPEPREDKKIVGFTDQESGKIFETLASETTRDILERVYNQPGTTSEIAEGVNTSIQNAKYHLDKLEDAELIEVAETWYSEQGNEMKVYVPTNESVVVFAGDEDRQSIIRETLSRLLGIAGVLTVSSILVERVVRVHEVSFTTDQTSPVWSVIPITEPIFIAPGLLFFVGGSVVLLLVLGASLIDLDTSSDS